LVELYSGIVYNTNTIYTYIMNQSLLLERLRLQSNIQRLIRLYGREGCLDLMHQAIELELPRADTKYPVQSLLQRPNQPVKHMS
jgi:hypothetical protein